MAREALKLYLLLVVSSPKTGQERRISWQALRKALGSSLVPGKMARLARVLGRYRLADVRVIARSDRGRVRGRRPDPEVRFTVFETGVLQERKSRRQRRQGERRRA